jgi:hypothetical protein
MAARRPLAIVAALACASCGRASVTAVDVRATFDSASPIEQLRFELLDGMAPLIMPSARPAIAGAPLPSGSGVAILLGDGEAGRSLTARVTGVRAGIDVVTGSATITPARGATITVEVPLAQPAPAPPTAITVAPTSATISSGNTAPFTASGHFADGDHDVTSRVTWASADEAVATVGAGGLAVAKKPGHAAITASWGAVSGSATLIVSDATLASIEVTAAAATLRPAAMQQYKAIGHYSDGSTQDLTAQASWSSTSQTVAMVSDSTGTKGLCTALALGSTEIDARFGMVKGGAPLTVQ